jgi:hypothetical protein
MLLEVAITASFTAKVHGFTVYSSRNSPLPQKIRAALRVLDKIGFLWHAAFRFLVSRHQRPQPALGEPICQIAQDEES